MKLVHANGVDLCAESFGGAGDPMILLVHGTAGCMLLWDDELCQRLAAGGRYDLRDAGRSVSYPVGKPDYGLRDLVEDAGHEYFPPHTWDRVVPAILR